VCLLSGTLARMGRRPGGRTLRRHAGLGKTLIRHFLIRFLGPLAFDPLALPSSVGPLALEGPLVLGASPQHRFLPSDPAALARAVDLAVITLAAHDDQEITPSTAVLAKSFGQREPEPPEPFLDTSSALSDAPPGTHRIRSRGEPGRLGMAPGPSPFLATSSRYPPRLPGSKKPATILPSVPPVPGSR
jgi:hypothetical protein